MSHSVTIIMKDLMLPTNSAVIYYVDTSNSWYKWKRPEIGKDNQ